MNIKLFLVFTALTLIIGCQSSSTVQSKIDKNLKTLYSDLGGKEKINVAVTNMVKRLHNDERLGELFNEVDDVELIKNFNDFICRLSDGGCEYNGATMEDIHAELYISKAEFDRFVSMFIYSMQDASIPFTAQNKLLAKLANLRSVVIEL